MWQAYHIKGQIWGSGESARLPIMCPRFDSRTRGLFLESSGNFSGPESHSKISNLLITELFYSQILNMNRGSLYTRSFRCKHLSVFSHRLVKNGFMGLKSFRGAPGVICALSLLLVLYSAARCSSPGTPVFPLPLKSKLVHFQISIRSCNTPAFLNEAHILSPYWDHNV